MYKRSLFVLALVTTAAAQTPAATPAPGPPLAFEVAAIKPAPPIDPAKIMSGKMKIGMTVNAARVDIGALSLADLIRMAYKVKGHQLQGPDWMGAQRFDIQAKMPEGATKEQVPEMMKALLADRFKMTMHRETKDQPIYALVVGKNGPKMKDAEPDPPPAAAGDAPHEGPPGKGGMVVGQGENQVRITQNSDGKSSTISGPMGQMKMSMADGMMRMEFPKMTMVAFTEFLTRFVDRPVVDMTELKGTYQVAVSLSMEEMGNIARKAGAEAGIMMPMGRPGGGGGDTTRVPSAEASAPSSSVFNAVQQLGLKLDGRKAPVEIVVIDHLEKEPTEN